MITKNIALMFLGLVAVSTSGTYAVVQNVQQGTQIEDEQGAVVGHVTVTVTDENGNIKAYRQSDNAIVDVGLDELVDKMWGTSLSSVAEATKFLHVEIGTGAVAGTPGDLSTGVTTLIALCPRSLSVATGDTAVQGTVGVDLAATFTDDNCVHATINEAALFSAASAGGIFAHSEFTAVAVTASDTLTINWAIDFT